MHVLLLTDRDWTHPQGGGTGTNLYGQVSRWLEWGHRVTVIAGAYPGCEAISRPTEGLEIHRMGSRLTVFARAARATRRGVGDDADVVLEVVNGIAFFTPAWWWMKAPAVALVHHVHQDHYVTELGLAGRVAALLLERIPLAVLYRFRPVMTISHAARADMVALGVPDENIRVVYMGTEPSTEPEHPESPTPNLLYLGRLKAYKRIENLLAALELVPGAHLEIAGDGDHREALAAEIAERGLTERVTLHGFVSEAEKTELYDRAWVSLTASSAEGWCLTVMEAADRGTPSAALRVGGLPESIVDGQTGVLCDTPEELATEVAALCADEPRRHRLGEAAQARARGFTWEHTARANLDVLESAVSAGRRPLRSALTGSDTGKAAGLAGASLMNNAIQLAFTVAITRILGKADYSALAAIISAFLVLLVGGQSIQAAAAREVALGRLGDHHALLGTIRGWTRTLLVATVVAAIVGVVLREPLGALMGVEEHAWAAGAVLPTGVLWMLLSLQRGVLQGLHAYAPVGLSIIGEALGRLAFGLTIALAAGGVTGVFLASPAAFLVTSVGLAMALTRRLSVAPELESTPPAAVRTLRTLMANGWVPIISLALLAILQNVDVIVARHELGDDRAGSYAVAAVAAKVVIWVAIGVGLQLLPQATARAAAGEDPRPVLFRALAVLAAVAAPSLLLFALFPKFILKTAFGPDTVDAAPALLLLTLAMTLLAVAYLTVQYMLALGSVKFLWVLGAVAAIEIPLLLGGDSITGFATLVLGAQLVVATAVLAIGLRAGPRTTMISAA